jgi:transcriptional regulator with XRE-family HTH domain
MMDSVTVSGWVGQAVREARKRRGWTQEVLAARCAEVGAPHITAAVLYGIEHGRATPGGGKRYKQASAADVLALALALDISPVHLLVPFEGDLELTPTRTVAADQARMWVRGQAPLPGMRHGPYWGFVPESELARAAELAKFAANTADFFRSSPGEGPA